MTRDLADKRGKEDPMEFPSEQKRQDKYEIGRAIWAARKSEIETAIGAALDALGVAHTIDEDSHVSNWLIGDPADDVKISVNITPESRGGSSYYARAFSAGDRARVKLDGYGGPQFQESKGAAKKSGGARASDFDYPAIAAKIVELRDRRLEGRKAHDARAVHEQHGRAVLAELTGDKKIDQDLGLGWEGRLDNNTVIKFRPSAEGVRYEIKIEGLSETELRRIVSLLKGSKQ